MLESLRGEPLPARLGCGPCASILHVLLMLEEAGDSRYVWSDGFELKLES